MTSPYNRAPVPLPREQFPLQRVTVRDWCDHEQADIPAGMIAGDYWYRTTNPTLFQFTQDSLLVAVELSTSIWNKNQGRVGGLVAFVHERNPTAMLFSNRIILHHNTYSDARMPELHKALATTLQLNHADAWFIPVGTQVGIHFYTDNAANGGGWMVDAAATLYYLPATQVRI